MYFFLTVAVTPHLYLYQVSKAGKGQLYLLHLRQVYFREKFISV